MNPVRTHIHMLTLHFSQFELEWNTECGCVLARADLCEYVCVYLTGIEMCCVRLPQTDNDIIVTPKLLCELSD